MPSGVRLIFALHNHQPVGNFDDVFEAAYRDSYRPFLDLAREYPDIPLVLHTSGPLLEWLHAQRPDYVAELGEMARAGRVEILGGAFQEPILPNIPRRDRVGQVRRYAEYLRATFGVPVRGLWLPERVWEQSLVASLAEAGVEYTVLDDFHFQAAGVPDEGLFGYYLTEDEGRLLKVFPNSERMRYLVPWREPHESYEYLRRLADERPGAVVVCADDGEKFGAWPQTHEHVFTNGWLRRFFDMIRANRSWLEPTTLARAVDETLPMGKVYLPDASYREMTEWALTPRHYRGYLAARRAFEGHPEAEHLRRFVRPGGFWRNFRAKYAESDEMYTRMLGISDRLAALEQQPGIDPSLLDAARAALYRGQCNCPYWHGAFGGLYLPHLRNAIYGHLIAAHERLDEAEGKRGSRVEAETGDFNLDARQEVRIENDHLIAFLRPSEGGLLYELDERRTRANLLATLDRRAEAYHEAIAAHANGQGGGPDAPPAVARELLFKQEGLDRLLVYDPHPRKAFVDHFLPLDASPEALARCAVVDLGDFARGAYLGTIEREPGRVRVVLERTGRAAGRVLRVRKTYELEAGSPALVVHYRLDDLAPDAELLFGVELNVASLAGRSDDRYYRDADRRRLGRLDARLDLPPCEALGLVDAWLDLDVGLSWTRPAAVWSFPIETVSQSEGGFEGVYQSSAILPRWVVRGDAGPAWEVTIRLDLGRTTAPEPLAASRRPAAVVQGA